MIGHSFVIFYRGYTNFSRYTKAKYQWKEDINKLGKTTQRNAKLTLQELHNSMKKKIERENRLYQTLQITHMQHSSVLDTKSHNEGTSENTFEIYSIKGANS